MPPTRKDDVLKYLVQHTGTIVFLSDMAKVLDMDERSVQNVMYRLKGEDPGLFKVKVRGRSWFIHGSVPEPEFVAPFPSVVREVDHHLPLNKVMSNAVYGKEDRFDPQNPAIFDQVGVAENGDIIAMDSNTNKLYRVVPL